jgi:hypothetical protein
MSWQFLAQRLLRHLPLQTRTVPTVRTLTHEPPCDQALAEVYCAHAAIHGPHKLLPEHTLPCPSSGREREGPEAVPEG